MHKPKSTRWILWIGLLGVLVFGVMMVFGFLAMLFSGGSGGGGGSGGHRLHEQVVEGSGNDKIVVIHVEGVISNMSVGGLFGGGESLVDRVTKQLVAAGDDPAVKAVVLEINSPGGGVTASDILYNEVKKLHDKKKKPVVVHMGDVCASGGYYISAPCDKLVASPTTITGSIGVIMSFFDAHQLFEEKLNIEEHTIKSGPHKDIGSMYRKPTEADLMILQTLVNEMYGRFVDIVIEGRKKAVQGSSSDDEFKKKIKELADGRVYTGEQAFKNGLVDKIGYLDDAYEEAKTLAGLKTAKIIEYRHVPTLADLLSGDADSKVNINHGVQVDLGGLIRQSGPLLEYRWKP